MRGASWPGEAGKDQYSSFQGLNMGNEQPRMASQLSTGGTRVHSRIQVGVSGEQQGLHLRLRQETRVT